mgnify:CR=1 FL=1
MKKHLLLASILLSSAYPAFAEYVTAGDGTEYTLQSLSEISESGVTKDGNDFIVADNITISEGDKFNIGSGITIKMGDAVQLRIEGEAYLDAEAEVLITRNADTDEPEGIGLFSDAREETLVKNLNFEYAGLRLWTEKEVTVENCSFKYNNGVQTSAGALSMALSGGQLNVYNSEFIENTIPAIGGAANYNFGVLVDNCYFYDNNTENSNKPQLNITIGGDRDIVITNNTITGAERNMVGGISVSNMLNASGSNNVVIENNDIRKHRYGITTLGGMNATIKGNKIIDNKYETNAMNGGSGISIYDSNYVQNTVITGNQIEDNLWGITVIGGGNVNIGKTDDMNADDYNPGENTFLNNGNNGVLYDLYNNGTNTIYAQGNQWNVEKQTEELIESVIFHKNDNASLGEVIFMPPMSSGSVSKIGDSNCFFDSTNKQLVLGKNDCNVAIYTTSGMLVASYNVCNGTVDMSHLAEGVYIAVVTYDEDSTSIKCIL